MIRKVSLTDNTAIMSFLRRESSFNLFIIGDIENFGYSTEFQDLWAEFGSDGNPCAVLLRYYRHYVLYADENCDAQGFAAIIAGDTKAEMVSGKQRVIESIVDFLPVKQQRDFQFAELTDASLLSNVVHNNAISKVSLDDVDGIFRLYDVIDEFTRTPSSSDAFRKNMESGSGRSYGYRVGTEFISLASTAAENSLSAMVVGVCTHPHYRGKGYATLCLTALCREILAEGRALCLFYDNPDAGAMYARIGFRNIGVWSVLDVQR